MDSDGSIAVIGVACRFPGAASARHYWDALTAGTEGITHYQRDDLVAAGAAPELVKRSDYVPARGSLPGARNFDWSFFGYSRAEAATIDPQHRIFLECASAAIDDAGIDPARFPGWTGVYAGADGVSGSRDETVSPLVSAIGQRPDFLTSRVAYKLGLRGPAITVQTACSTSLTAVHLAIQSLLGRECDAALAGGVAVAPPGEWGYLYQEGGILSPDGHCRPFDQDAAGTVPSEGVGIVVLRRLADALRDGDRIAAVIVGSAVNNDGGDKIGYTAPSVPGQRDVIRLAQQVAGVDPGDIDYVEAHGTGTRIGDPVEMQALTDAFRMSTQATGSCWIGAVKSNIGHTGAAAGIAGLIKTVLMLEHGELVPTLHFTKPNPLMRLEETPFRVCKEHGPWPDRGTPLAAVSSFGVGGTNAHVVVQGPPQRDRTAGGGPRVIALSATSERGLAGMRRDLAGQLQEPAGVSLAEVSRTLAGRRAFDLRQAIVAQQPQEAAQLLHGAPDLPAAGCLDRIAFVFPGQGTLGYAAGAAAYRLLPGFRASFDEVADAIRSSQGLDLSPVVIPASTPPEWFSDTVNQQLGLLALGYALGRQLSHWGITPAAMLGNSIGEYAAATLAGTWTLPDAAGLVHERAQAMRATEPGRMAAVSATVAEVARRLGPGSGVSIAVAAPGRVVISGRQAALDDLLAAGALDGIQTRLLDNQRAFHSPAMDPAAKVLRDAVAAVPSQVPALRLVSNVTGQWADPGAVRTPDYWADQLRQTVLLDDGMATMLATDCDVFLELGPGTSMSGGLRRHREWDSRRVAMPMLGNDEEAAERSLLRVLGFLWERGAKIDLEELLSRQSPDVQLPVRCSLPGHPFEPVDPDVEQLAAQPSTARRHAPGTQDPEHSVVARLWCRALGVPSAIDADDFFDLGGESLMAVDLVSQVNEHTAATVSVAEFTQAPTFGRLAELARQRLADRSDQEVGARSPAPGIVTLRRGGELRPLFLAADALGTATSYQVLARHLGDRPVYGLEPDSRLMPPRMLPRVEDLAAQHVQAVVRTQPSGPYLIGGWSFGAMVAHEMARQLILQGRRVDLLICLDGCVPNRGGRPIVTDPAFLLMSLRLQASAALGIGTVGGLVRRTPELRRRYLARMGGLLRYRPQPVPCPAVLFQTAAGRPMTPRQRRRLSAMYGGGMRVRPVSGDHWSMLTEPHARSLGERLGQELLESESKP